MNADPTRYPLPHPERGSAHRRQHISGLALEHHAVRQFQQAADRLGAESPVPDADLVASTGRVLLRQFRGFRRAPPVSVRRRWLTALRTMDGDPGWRVDPGHRTAVSALLAYDAQARRLIPDAVPVIGGLDDALLVDMAWPQLQAEMDAYMAFRRARMQATCEPDSDRDANGFDRDRWQRLMDEQRAWRQHQRMHGLSHYAAPACARFRVF